jgi:MFS family permease
LVVTGSASTLIALVDPGALLLVLIASLSGFASGMTMPSRDMIVRSVTPQGSFGKVFGFVTTGFHIGGMVAPLIFAQFLDHGYRAGYFSTSPPVRWWRSPPWHSACRADARRERRPRRCGLERRARCPRCVGVRAPRRPGQRNEATGPPEVALDNSFPDWGIVQW